MDIIKFIKRIFALALILLIGNISLVADANQLKTIQHKQKVTHEKIKRLKVLEHLEKNKLYKNQQKLEQASNNLQQSQSEYASLNIQLQKMEKDLTASLAEFNKANVDMRRRIRQVYKNQRTGMFQLILTAKDLNGISGGVFKSFIKKLDELDYVPKWKVMLAAEYGVPQLRERLILVATRKPNGFEFPVPTHASPEKCGGFFSLLPYVTVGDVINDLREPIQKTKDSIIPEDSHYDVTPKRDRERIHGVPEGRNLSSQLHLPIEQRGRLSRKDTTKFLRLCRTKPSNTLRGGEIFYHPEYDRYLTPREYMRIHGFPDSYVLKGPIRGRTGTVKDLDQHRQIGNQLALL